MAAFGLDQIQLTGTHAAQNRAQDVERGVADVVEKRHVLDALLGGEISKTLDGHAKKEQGNKVQSAKCKVQQKCSRNAAEMQRKIVRSLRVLM